MRNKFGIGVFAVFIILLASCKNSSKNEELEIDKHTSYIEAVDQKVLKLSVERKQQRAKWLDELSKNPVYVDLVKKFIVSEEYLPVLNTISHAIKNTYSVDGISQFGISEDLAINIEKSINSEHKMSFIIIVSSLSIDSNGGMPKEIVTVFDRYKQKYNLYGNNGTVLYDSAGKKIIIQDNYNLSYAFGLFNPEDTAALNAMYEATQKGIDQWSEESDENITFDNGFMALKNHYMNHLKKVHVNSPYLLNADFELNPAELYEDYKDNEVAADEKFRGKKIAITGAISDIGKDLTDSPYISFRVNGFQNIICYFDNEDVKTISKLSKSDNITIIGKCGGLILNNVIIRDCQIH